MEMARQTKTKATAGETTRAQATVRAATGNGIIYTENVSTVKEKKPVESIMCYKESSAAKLTDIQNNKTKIKISLYKRKRNHLKSLVNLYLTLILCISRINKTILKILRTKTKTNFNYTNNYAAKQKLQKKTLYFKAAKFICKLFIDFLTRFHYSKRKNLRSYVKLTIRHFFVGICLKRLISLKRLKQIPENRKQIDESLRSINEKTCYYGFIDHVNDPDWQLNKGDIVSFKNKSFMKSCKTLLNLQGKNKKCGQSSLNYLAKLIQITKSKKQTNLKPTADGINFKLQQLFLKCGQLETCKFKLKIIIVVGQQLKSYKTLNKKELQKGFIHSLEKCDQLFAVLKCWTFKKDATKISLQRIPKYCQEQNCRAEKSKNFDIQQTFSSPKCCPQNQHRVAVEHCYDYKDQIETFLNNQEEYKVFELFILIVDYNKKSGRVVSEGGEQIEAHFQFKHDQMGKLKASEIQEFSPNSPQKCDQVNNFQPKLQETPRRRHDRLTICRYAEIDKFFTNPSLQCKQLNKHTNLLNFNILREQKITHDLKIYFKILEISKLHIKPVSKHKVSLIVFKKTLYNDNENMSNLQKKHILLAVAYNQRNANTGQFLTNIKLQDRKFSNRTVNIGFISLDHENKQKLDNMSDKLTKIHQKFCIENGIRKQTSFCFINRKEEMKLAYKTNIARQFQLDDNNNSYQVESKQQQKPKKCQQILYSILFFNFCYSCYWHIYGFPLVLVKICKYLKDATVNVLTRRLKITATTTATSMCCNYDNIKPACKGKLNKPTKVADYKANQQNVLKRQKHTTGFSSGAYSSYCSTISLTTSSSYCQALKNLILLRKQPQQPCCQHYHHQHHRHKYQHHYHQYNRQEQLKQHCQEQLRPQPYKFIATIYLQLPSLLVFSRTLIILMLLSSLWHTSEGFHGSGVKLSTNTVRTKYGLVRGIVVRSSPSLVEAYLGIPYASPPVGSLRFMPPITPSTWKNIRNADRFSPVCPQNVPIPPNGPEALLEVPRARLAQLRRLLPLLSNQSEDCLYLNIYVPIENRRHRRFTTNSGELNDEPKLPAILFIHGESYEWNSGNPYDGTELAAHGNVIVITINFRLGILGFLKTGGKESAQGNFGLMDLVAGLHWLKENLPSFGGDPQQITLFGHGTGSALANILVVSPVASDLIQHTVMVSGSALSPWAIQKNPLFVKRRVAEQTGCHGDMLYYDLAPCLRTKSVNELLAVKIDHPRFLVGFAPFIDGTVISPKTDSIGKLSLPLGSAIVSTSGIEYANFPKRNLIFCLTSVESHLDLNAQDLEFGFNETRRDRILRTYVRNSFHYHLNEIFAVLKNEYTEWDKAIRSPLSSRDATLQFLSDGHTASSLIKLGYMHSIRGGKGYFLHFKHRTVEEEYPQRTGSVRGEDVPFWLGLPISPLFPHNYTTQEKQISRLMLRYLANFAKTGNPNRSSLSSPLTSSSSLIASPPSSSSSSSSFSYNQTAEVTSEKIKRSSSSIVNATSSTSSGPNKSSNKIEDVATAAAREAFNLAVLYNQRRTKRTYYKRHSRSNDDHSESSSSEVNYFLSTNNNNNNNKNNKLDSDELPFWDAYDIVNQLYMELGNKAEIQSHYRGHKLSMWLNLIPQLHRHANMNDQSMRHHQFQDDLNNLNLYEGIVRAQIQTKPDDDDETLLLSRGRPTATPPALETNGTQKPPGGTTECGVDGAMFVAEMTTLPPNDNRSLALDSREKEMATASTGLIGNLEVLRRLGGKQFQSYTTALIATVAVGCFLLILNVLIFAGIYHQREKRARDAKTKEELQDNDTSKTSSILKLNAMGSETGSFNDSGAGVSGKTTVVFGEYSCYDEKSLQTKDEKLIVELPPSQIGEANWAGCSTSTLDLLKTKHHSPLDNSYTLSSVVPINTESQTEHLIGVNNLEMMTYNPLPMASGVIIDPSFATTSSSASGLLSKRGSIVGSSGQLNQYDFASVQSSDQMSFKDIENAVKASAARNDDITQDDDIPEPPPPPRSFQSMQQQQQKLQQAVANAPTTTSGSGGGGILRQAGATSATQTGGGKKRVHIQEISV